MTLILLINGQVGDGYVSWIHFVFNFTFLVVYVRYKKSKVRLETNKEEKIKD